jgi:polyhydroxyalkanoate synthase
VQAPWAEPRVEVRAAGARTLGPDEWQNATTPQEGSWRPQWKAWLEQRSSSRADPPALGAPGFEALCDAAGTYVLEP